MTEWDVRVVLYGISGFFALLFLIFVCYGIGGSVIQNLFSTAVGSVFTIFVVDNLLKYAESRRTAPVRFAAYREARGLYDRCRFLWVQMLVAVLDKPPPQDADLFDKHYCLKVCTQLDLDRPAPILPACSWRAHISTSSDEIIKGAGEYFVRYNNIANSQFISLIHQLETHTFYFIADLFECYL